MFFPPHGRGELSKCFLYVSLGSKVSPGLGLGLTLSVVLFICNASCVLYSVVTGVLSVYVVCLHFERDFSSEMIDRNDQAQIHVEYCSDNPFSQGRKIVVL